MQVEIGTHRVNAPEIPWFVMQIGVTRTGNVCIARQADGRFVAARRILWTVVEAIEIVSLPNPVRRTAPLARLVVSLALLAVAYRALGAWPTVAVCAVLGAFKSYARALKDAFVPAYVRGRPMGAALARE